VNFFFTTDSLCEQQDQLRRTTLKKETHILEAGTCCPCAHDIDQDEFLFVVVLAILHPYDSSLMDCPLNELFSDVTSCQSERLQCIRLLHVSLFTVI